MDQRKLILLVGAVIIAVVSVVYARTLLSQSHTPVPIAQAVIPAIAAPKGPRVLVAQRSLPVGTILTPDAIGFQEWPKDMVRDAYFLDGTVVMDKLLGTVVRFPITAGQPLTQGALVAPGDRGFLAAALSPGMRAVTIPVSEKSAVAGFVFPGDHVDLMLTQTVQNTAPPGAGADASKPLNVTETILKNLRVLATNQSLEPVTENGKTVPNKGIQTVTLEVTPRIAEKIEVAQSLGTLNLTLRSITDDRTQPDPSLTTGPAKSADSNSKSPVGMNAPIDGPGSFSTGGDVSRFQRRSAARPVLPGGRSGTGVQVIRGSTLAKDDAGDARPDSGTISPATPATNAAGPAGSTTGVPAALPGS